MGDRTGADRAAEAGHPGRRRQHRLAEAPAATLTGQYHFTGLGAFKPYLGAGVNYTRFSSVDFNPAVAAALQPSIEKSSVGLALQAGVDYAIGRNLVLNFDVKKLQIRTDVMSAGNRIGTLKVDPWLVGVGLGWRF